MSIRTRNKLGASVILLSALALVLSALLPFVRVSGSAATAYVTPDGLAVGNCPAGTTTFTPTQFNDSANWGSGVDQMGPGTVVLICGTITFGNGATGLVPVSSGTNGAPVTMNMDDGAIIQAPYFGGNPESNCGGSSCGGGISIPNRNYITINGRGVGIIQNTANGSQRANQQASVGVYARGDHILIENLIVRNIYVNCPQGISCADTAGFQSAGIRVDGSSTNIEICGNVSTASHRGISTDTSGGTGGNTLATCSGSQAQAGVNIHHNTTSDHGWQIIATGSGSPNIYSNTSSDWSNWVYPTGGFYHLDGIILFGDTGLVLSPYVYGNWVFGDMTINGGSPTSFVFCTYGDTGSGSACNVFNNVLQGTGSYSTQGQGVYLHGADGHPLGPHRFLNNTLLGFGTGQIYQDGDSTIFNTFKGNIYSGNGAQWFIQGNTSPDNHLTTNANVYYNGRGHPWSWGNDNSFTTLAGWTAGCLAGSGTGCDATSSVANPLLDASFIPQTGSSAIGRGENFTSLNIPALNVDKNGTPRPTSGAWDAGALQTTTVTNTIKGQTTISGNTRVGLPTPAPSQVFADATNGSDSNPGTFASPVKTIRKAADIAQGHCGWEIVLRGGLYPESVAFTSADSGCPGQLMAYHNYPGEFPIVSGGVVLPSTWVNCTGGNCPAIPTLTCAGACTAKLLQLTTASYAVPEQMFYNGVRRERPRIVFGSYLIQRAATCTGTQSTNCFNRGNCGVGQFECFDRVGRSLSDTVTTYHGLKSVHSVAIDMFENWTMAKLRLAESNADANACTTTGTLWCATGPTTESAQYGPSQSHRYQLENVREGLNQAGQFYWDQCPTTDCSGGPEATTNLYYMAKPGEDPNTAQIIVPQTSVILSAIGMRYASFSGIQFSYDRYFVPDAGQKAISFASNISAAISFLNSSNITFDRNTFAHLNNYAIEFVGTAATGQGNVLTNNVAFDLGSGAFRIGQIACTGTGPVQCPNGLDTDANVSQSNLIQNNLLFGGQRVLAGGIGIAVFIGNSHNNTVQNNTMFDWYSGAINVGTTLNNPSTQGPALAHDNLILANDIYDIGQGVTSDEGFIHTATSSATGNQLIGNRMHDMMEDPSASGYGGYGVYLDQASTGWLIQNNLVYRTSSASLNMSVPSAMHNNTVINNVFAYGKNGVWRKVNDETNLMVTMTRNIFYWDKGNPDGGFQQQTLTTQAIHSGWFCFSQACSTIFNLDFNDYFNSTSDLNANAHAFFLTDGTNTFNPTWFTFSTWKSVAGEDQHSMIGDPLFNNPGFAAGDDYSLKPASPVPAGIGFSPFLPFASVGVNASLLPAFPASVAATFPLQLLNKNTDF